MGRIACANVLSDLYAVGCVDIDNLLMMLAAPQEMAPELRLTVLAHVMRGFRDAGEEAGAPVGGGQTVFNPWLLCGGAASSVCARSELIANDTAADGHYLVLTKPLGTQVAVNAYQWLVEGGETWRKVQLAMDSGSPDPETSPDPDREKISSENVVRRLQRNAIASMCRLNRNAARLMHKYKATAATDVTGFGLLGHASQLASVQKRLLRFRIDTLPLLDGARQVEEASGACKFQLLAGRSAETSGGLLVALPTRRSAEEFVDELTRIDRWPASIVGRVEAGEKREAVIVADVSVQISSPLD